MPKIMLVDNDKNIVYVLKEMLRSLGYNVVGTADSGAEAVAMAAELNPDLIIMNVDMPGESDTMNAAASIMADTDIPVIFLTNRSQPEILSRAKRIKPYGYIQKNFQEDQTRAAVDVALDRKEAERELINAYKNLERTVKEKDAELRKKNEQLMALLNATRDTAFLIDTEGVVMASNAVTAERYKVPLDAFLGSSVYDLMPPELAKIRKSKAEKVIRTGKACRFEDRRRGIIFDSTIYPVLNEKGKVIQLAIYGRDITHERQTQKAVMEKEKELKERAQQLEEANTAVKVILNRISEERTEMEEKVVANVTELIEPHLGKLKEGHLDHQQKSYLKIIEGNLREIVSPLAYRLSSRVYSLTPKEIRIAELIRSDRATKEIAKLLNISMKTVEYHRDNIRKKLGIKKEKINLRSHLLSLE